MATLRTQAESLAVQGWDYGKIADHLGMSDDYARHVVTMTNGTGSNHDPFRPSTEDTERHIGACLAEGGFPFAFHWMGETVLVNLDGGFWRHMPKGRAAA